MSKSHSGLTGSSDLHVPKGFTEAAVATAPVKDEAGALEWREISELGGQGSTGSPGPAGSALATRYDNVKVATTAAITLSSDAEAGKTVDGIVLATSDSILIKDQVNLVENGPYIVQAVGTPVRRSGTSAGTTANAGDYLWVERGTENTGNRYQVATSASVGTDNYQFDKTEDISGLGPFTFIENVTVLGAQARVGVNDETGNGSGNTFTVNWDDSNNQIIDLQDFSGNVTLTLSNPGDGAVYSLAIRQGSTARTVTWPSSVKWPGGSAPTITTTDNRIDIIVLYYSSDLAAYIASFSQDYDV